jgi:hypothetical protein
VRSNLARLVLTGELDRRAGACRLMRRREQDLRLAYLRLCAGDASASRAGKIGAVLAEMDAADREGDAAWRELFEAVASIETRLQRLGIFLIVRGHFSLPASARRRVVTGRYFAIVMAGPVSTTVDTLIWNNW